jgi:hypothetical protein
MENSDNVSIGFFEEKPGQKSSQRLVFIIGTFYSMIMGAWVFYATHDYTGLIATVTSLAAVFIGGKLIQKTQEK